jgi:hypothetical protein
VLLIVAELSGNCTNNPVEFLSVYMLPEFDALVKRALATKDPKQTRDSYSVYHSIVLSLHADCIMNGYISNEHRYMPRKSVGVIFQKLYNVYPFLLDDDNLHKVVSGDIEVLLIKVYRFSFYFAAIVTKTIHK